MVAGLNLFKECYQRADEAIAKATKEELAECARLLAFNVGHYRKKYRELPLEEQGKFFNATEMTQKRHNC